MLGYWSYRLADQIGGTPKQVGDALRRSRYFLGMTQKDIAGLTRLRQSAFRRSKPALSSRCLKPEHRPGSWRQRCLNASLGFKLYATQWDWLNLIGIIPRIHRVQIKMMELSSFAQS